MAVQIPPPQGPAVSLRSIRIERVQGYWEIYDGDMNLVTDREYACAETDTIRGCITVSVLDNVPIDPAYMRSAVVAFELAYTFPPDPGDPDSEESFLGVAPGYYTCATENPGDNQFTLCGPFMGVNGSAFYHFPLTPGTYGTWITAGVAFLFFGALILPWTFGTDIEVFPCPPTLTVPILTTIPQPPSPKGGDEIWDTAQLQGGLDPQGTIRFRLWEDDDETSLLYEEIVDVDGNGTYQTQKYPVPEGVPWPDGIHWHWKADYSGDANNTDAHSGAEPVDIAPEIGFPSGSTQFAFSFTSEVSGDHPGAISPGVARFQQADLGQLWFTRTKDDVNTIIAPADRTPVGPSLAGHLAVGEENYEIEIFNQTGGLVYNIPPVDDIIRPMQYQMGVAYNWENGDLYAALTPDPVMAFTPHDVDWFKDDSGILVAVVVGPGQLEFRKYDYAGAIQQVWTPAVEPGWYQQPVKIALACTGNIVFYTFHGTTIKRYNLDTSTQLSDYLTLSPYSGYRYGDLQVLRNSNNPNLTPIVVTMTQVGSGPHRGVAVGPANSVWNDRNAVAEKRNLSSLHLILQTNASSKIHSMACYFDGCQVTFPVMVTLIH